MTFFPWFYFVPCSYVSQGWSHTFLKMFKNGRINHYIHVPSPFTGFWLVILGKLFKTGNVCLAAYENRAESLYLHA